MVILTDITFHFLALPVYEVIREDDHYRYLMQ